jgi:hypothetical protein
MMYMLVFLIGCIGLGLWAPRHAKLGKAIAVLAALLVLFFFIAPHRM